MNTDNSAIFSNEKDALEYIVYMNLDKDEQGRLKLDFSKSYAQLVESKGRSIKFEHTEVLSETSVCRKYHRGCPGYIKGAWAIYEIIDAIDDVREILKLKTRSGVLEIIIPSIFNLEMRSYYKSYYDDVGSLSSYCVADFYDSDNKEILGSFQLITMDGEMELIGFKDKLLFIRKFFNEIKWDGAK